jgi:hypothetical protein
MWFVWDKYTDLKELFSLILFYLTDLLTQNRPPSYCGRLLLPQQMGGASVKWTLSTCGDSSLSKNSTFATLVKACSLSPHEVYRPHSHTLELGEGWVTGSLHKSRQFLSPLEAIVFSYPHGNVVHPPPSTCLSHSWVCYMQWVDDSILKDQHSGSLLSFMVTEEQRLCSLAGMLPPPTSLLKRWGWCYILVAG